MNIRNWIMDIHYWIMDNSIVDIHNYMLAIMDIHNLIMAGIHNLIMDIHNLIMDIHNYRVYALWHNWIPVIDLSIFIIKIWISLSRKFKTWFTIPIIHNSIYKKKESGKLCRSTNQMDGDL